MLTGATPGPPIHSDQLVSANGGESLEIHSQPVPPGDAQGHDLRRWVQCAAAFCIFFNTWGLITSFGAFQTYYATTLLRAWTSSQISWIGTLQSCFICFGALYARPLYDLGYMHSLINVGSLLMTTGMVATSFCRTFWQVLLAQGCLTGLGLGCIFIPTITILATWFERHRGVAMGIASSGSAIGFSWTVRALALILLVLFIIPVIGMKMRIHPLGVHRSFDVRPWRERPYQLFAIALFIGYVGLYIPYFYFQLYCIRNDIFTDEFNVFLIALINAGGFFGRLASGKLADMVGPINALIVGSGVCTVLLLGWMGVHSAASAITFAVLYGFFSATAIILPPTAIAVSLCPDIKQYPARMTMQMVPFGLGILIGNPIAGAILDHGWVPLQGFSAVSIATCMIVLVWARVSKVGVALKSKC